MPSCPHDECKHESHHSNIQQKKQHSNCLQAVSIGHLACIQEVQDPYIGGDHCG